MNGNASRSLDNQLFQALCSLAAEDCDDGVPQTRRPVAGYHRAPHPRPHLHVNHVGVLHYIKSYLLLIIIFDNRYEANSLTSIHKVETS